MTQSNRGSRGIPGAMVAGYFDYHRIPNVDPQGAWASQTFTANGVFTAPMNGVFLNKNRKVDCYITAIAAGGAGGSALNSPTAGLEVSAPQGGQSGDFCIRYKLSLFPGEQVQVSIPSASSGNGASLSFGTYLTLSGGIGGSSFSQATSNLVQFGYNPGTATSGGANQNGSRPTGGTIISGSLSTDSAIYRGCSGGPGAHWHSYSTVTMTGLDGQSNIFRGNNYGGSSTNVSDTQSGGGGAGLFGPGGDGSNTGTPAAPLANSGAGGGGGGGTSGASGAQGAAGQCLVEWRVPA